MLLIQTKEHEKVFQIPQLFILSEETERRDKHPKGEMRDPSAEIKV
jgi:hypothetical protein